MDIPRLIREQIAALEQRLVQRIANQIQITTVSRSTAKGEEDGAEGWPDSGKAYQRSTRRMQHFGFRSRPPKNSAAVMLLVGGGNASEVTVAEGSDGYGPEDLAEGEAALFSMADGTEILVKKGTDGIVIRSTSSAPITIEAGAGANVTIDAGAGGSVVLNGGVLNVARATDTAGPYPITGGNPFVKA